MPRVEPGDQAQWRGLLVAGEMERGRLAPITRELLGKGRELCKALDVPLSCAVLAKDAKPAVEEATSCGADRVFSFSHPSLEPYTAEQHAHALVPLIEETRPEAVLLGSTRNGRDLAGRMAVLLKTGIGADSTDLRVDGDTRQLEMIKPAFGGLVNAAIVCPDYRPQIATVRPNVFRAPVPEPGRAAEVEVRSFEPVAARTRVLEQRPAVVAAGPAVKDSEVVVCVGRGVGGPERVEAAGVLARMLGGTLAGTRPVADEGWVPQSQMVGQTGAFIRPRLYIGLGVSGQAAHTVGLAGTRTLVAVNTDPEAPLFDLADIAVEADLATFLPALVAEVERRLGKGRGSDSAPASGPKTAAQG